ncbi:PREDICTED: PIN2/TERF1-interacting telomerase inhibitor 1-like [Papilio polytes]|uniref:PIN2/TERF1-interacting telomerase inhibitor 1-like n=1 Tax=Papilio polytes TaxID=76194 RepID=UPI00067686CC|nr:PREDICTED: PIN2/TERF1-interacting telomerase inhibitor 1-like [Papilio polytes]
MAMLAGPRRKQKVINLRAKNNEWSNDTNKFGQRMLEKMGWTSGKGLGANENGIVEHVVARYKNDEKGLGFEDRNDQWTKHEDDFNSLLANLSNANDDGPKLHSGVSLEDKSKKSKARIHYHKFTRGKDLSRYSEKDLANIFGKKSFKQEDVTETSVVEESTPTEQVFTEKGSMEDYFKNKMAAIKSKNKTSLTKHVEPELDWEDEPRCGFQGFLGTINQEVISENKNSTGHGDLVNGLENGEDVVNLDNQPKTKKKKKKKSKDLDNELCDKIEDEPQVEILKKKQKGNAENSPQESDDETQKECKKRKRDKAPIEENDVDVSVNKPKKKKKRKNKDL